MDSECDRKGGTAYYRRDAPETEAFALFRNALDGLLESPGRWLLRREREGELSPELTRVFAEATEQILSRHLTFLEKRAILQTALARLRRSVPSAQREIRDHLYLLDRLVPLLGRLGRRFGNLSPESRHKCLQICERSRWSVLSEGHARLRHLVQIAYLECAEVWPEAGPEVRKAEPAGQFLERRA